MAELTDDADELADDAHALAGEAHAPTRRGVHARLSALTETEARPGDSSDFNPRRTLRLRVEFARQLKRRRTVAVFGLLLLLPVVMAVAFEVGGNAGSDAPKLVALATTGGFNFALFAEFAAVGFLLAVVVALFCGDTIASEASWSSLRYLLAQPVPRGRLLRQKLLVGASLSLAANVLLPLWSLFVGGLFFGWSPVHSPVGGTLDAGGSAWRLLIIVAYVCGQLLVVASLAFLLSTCVDNPLGAVGGAVLLVVVSNILDQITALDQYRKVLPTHFNYAWIDTLSAPIQAGDMLRGSGIALIYAAVFLGAAWLHFDRKDITS